MSGQCMTLYAVTPEMTVGAAALLLPALAGWLRGRWTVLPTAIAIVSVVGAIVLVARLNGTPPETGFCGTYAVDRLRIGYQLVILAGALVTLLLTGSHFRQTVQAAHAPIPILFTTLGAMGVVASNDLGLLVLSIELMGFGGYVLTALIRTDRRAQETALKYFLFGASALAIMAYGLTLLYGLSGSLAFPAIGRALQSADRVWVGIALALIIVGFAFEIAAAPFHFWAPDAFQGATAPIAGFLSVVPKVAAFGGLIRLLEIAFPGGLGHWPSLVALLSGVTMTFGNLVALRQTSLKRMLAYSTIAQAGYLLMGVAALDRVPTAQTAILFYLAAFAAMNLAAFGVVAMIERRLGQDALATMDGLGWRSPWTGFALALALLSLAGFPPLAGFAGKVMLLSAALQAGLGWLAILAIANMALALVYYVRPITRLYFVKQEGEQGIVFSPGYAAAIAAATMATVAFGIAPALALMLLGIR